MRKLIVFNQISIDGYIADAASDMSWAHRSDPEWNAFVAGNASLDGELLFGRTTYEQMAAFWPTPIAAQQMPEVARGINAAPKLVFSRTLTTASWNNTRIVGGDIVAEVRKRKAEPGPLMVVMGSASIVAQLAELVDEFQLVYNPIALGGGKAMFTGMRSRLPLALAGSRVFTNGNVLLTYAR